MCIKIRHQGGAGQVQLLQHPQDCIYCLPKKWSQNNVTIYLLSSQKQIPSHQKS